MEEGLMAALHGTCEDVTMATRVMVVDSDKASLKEMESLMVQCDYDVTPLDNPLAAVQMLKERKGCFDLVLSNILMHEMDILEFLDIVTNNLDIPVVLISDEEDQETFLKATLGGAKNVMLKPLRSHEMRNMWQHVLRHQRFKLQKRPREEDDIDESNEDSLRKQTEAGALESPPLEGQKWKRRFIWTTELKKKFAFAVDQLGFENATPSKILQIMGVSELTRKQIGSRLQKHRIFRRKCNMEGRKCKGLSVSGVLSSSSTPGLANQVAQPLPPKAVTEAQCGSIGSFTNMPSYSSSFRADDRRILGTYGLMKSTDPASIIGRAPSFMQEQRNRGDERVFQNPPIPTFMKEQRNRGESIYQNPPIPLFMQEQRKRGEESVFQNPSIPSFMQEQRNQVDENIFQNQFIAHAQLGFDPTSTMWSSSSNLNHGNHELLQLQGYAFGQQAANDDQLNSASTSEFGVAVGSNTEFMVNGLQFDDQYGRTSVAMSHDMHEQNNYMHPMAASETVNEGSNQIFQCPENEFSGLSSAAQPCTSSFEINPMNSTRTSFEMQHMPVTDLPVQMENLGDLYGNSNPYLDNMNAGQSTNIFYDLERMLNLMIPHESQLQPSDLEGFFPVNDQDYGLDDGAIPLHQPNQVFDVVGSQSVPSLSGS